MVATRSSDAAAVAAASPSAPNQLALRSRTIQTSTPSSRVSTPSGSARKRAPPAAGGQTDSPRPKRARVIVSSNPLGGKSDSSAKSDADSSIENHDSIATTILTHLSVDIPVTRITRQHKRFGSQEREEIAEPDLQSSAGRDKDQSEQEDDDGAPEVESTRRTPARARGTKARTSRSAKKTSPQGQDLTLTTPVSKFKDVSTDVPASASTTRSFQTANETMSDNEEDDTVVVNDSAEITASVDTAVPVRHEISDSDTLDDTTIIRLEPAVVQSTPTATANSINPTLINTKITFPDQDNSISFSAPSPTTPTAQVPHHLSSSIRPAVDRAVSQTRPQSRPRKQPRHNTSLSSFRANIIHRRVAKGTFRVQTSWDRRRHKFAV